MPVETASKSAIEVEVVRKATWRLLPFLMLAYSIAFVDQINSGFAARRMIHDIGLSHAVFGNALGNLAGFVDSFLIGAIQGATGSYALALLPLVLIAAVGCVAVPLLGSGKPATEFEG